MKKKAAESKKSKAEGIIGIGLLVAVMGAKGKLAAT